MTGLDKFAGGDQGYLRDVQYRDPSKLTARANLHIKYRQAPTEWFPWLVAQLDWPARGEVLEVGCGPGWMWSECGAAVPDGLRLTLTDLSPGMVDVARDRVTGLDRFTLVDAQVADAQDLPFQDGSFDVVVANHMLYHVPDPARAVAELARVLRPGGMLLASTNGPRHLGELWEIRSEVFGCPGTAHMIEAFGTITGAPLLRRVFAEVEWREYRDELRCTDPDDVVAFLTSTPPGEDVADDQLRALHAAVARRFAAGDGVLVVSKETGAFLAHKPR